MKAGQIKKWPVKKWLGQAVRLAQRIDRINLAVGEAVAWLAVALVLAQFLIVVLRYVFITGNNKLDDSVIYLHGMIFMLGVGYTLLKDAHVRVDIWYRDQPPARKALVDLLGAALFIIPLAIAIFVLSFGLVTSSWAILERGSERTGLPFIYLLKTVIWIFAFLLLAQGISMAIKSAFTLVVRPKQTVSKK